MIQIILNNKDWIDYILTFLAIIISIFALFRSYSTDKRMKQLEQAKEKEKHLNRKTNLILESEQQDALIGELLLILVKKGQLLEGNPNLQKNSQQEIKRLKNQIELFRSFKLNPEKRASLEQSSIGTNIDTYHQTHEKINQLTIQLETELNKEKYDYEELIAKNNIA